MLIRKSWGVFAICSTQLTTGVEELDALVAQKYSSRVWDKFRFMELNVFSTCFFVYGKGVPRSSIKLCVCKTNGKLD